MARNLGLVPSWQFSPDPQVNPLLNPYANIPAGWVSQSNPPQVAGIPTAGMTLTPALGAHVVNQLGYNPFESWWWTHRKKLVIGGLAVVGAAGLAIVTAVLR
jgi:hypothetical protein